jgi:hypothetical protein
MCADSGFLPQPATWSSSGGRLRVSPNQEQARFSASQPGTYTITAQFNGAEPQSIVIVKE